MSLELSRVLDEDITASTGKNGTAINRQTTAALRERGWISRLSRCDRAECARQVEGREATDHGA